MYIYIYIYIYIAVVDRYIVDRCGGPFLTAKHLDRSLEGMWQL